MLTFLVVMAGFGIAGGIFCLWGMVCTELTYRKRMQLLDTVYADKDWKGLTNDLDAVSFDKHMWALILFRSPRKLYSERIQREWPR